MVPFKMVPFKMVFQQENESYNDTQIKNKSRKDNDVQWFDCSPQSHDMNIIKIGEVQWLTFFMQITTNIHFRRETAIYNTQTGTSNLSKIVKRTLNQIAQSIQN